MMRSLWSAASGMIAQQLNVDTIANNLANVNTAGFKKVRADFQDLLYQTMRAPGSAAAEGVVMPTGIQVGLGTRLAATSPLFTPGMMQQTGNPLDLCIEGDGFFQIKLKDETAYTRAGIFKLDDQGNITTVEGDPLEPPLAIPAEAKRIDISGDGMVSVTMADGSQQQLGPIQLARFSNPAGLEAMGRSLFRATDASGEAQVGNPGENGVGRILSGTLELSNVQVVEEMVNMITAQRAYEANSRSIRIADDMLAAANNMRQ